MNREKTVEVTLGLDEADDDEALRRLAAKALKVPLSDVPHARVTRRAIDARRGRVRFVVHITLGPPPTKDELGQPRPREVKLPARVVIVGDGPAGLFCAYELARQ